MTQYRQDVTAQNAAAGQTRVATAVPPPSAPAYMSLAEKYGMTDMHIGGASGAAEQTIEQEYQAYITAPLSSSATDILKFWEVRGYDIDGGYFG